MSSEPSAKKQKTTDSKSSSCDRVRRWRARRATSCGQTNSQLNRTRQRMEPMPAVEPIFVSNKKAVNSDYDSSMLRSLYSQCIKYGVAFDNDISSLSREGFDFVVKRLQKEVAAKKQAEDNGLESFLPFNEALFESLSPVKQAEFCASHEHELYMYQLKHVKCSRCMSVSMVKTCVESRNAPGTFTCSECSRKNEESFFKIGCNRLLPVWFDASGTVHYEQPMELKDLRLGEQLLIQRLSVFVPVVHIRNGIMGLNGHCCCFSQQVSEVISSLPRKTVEVVVVVKGTVDKAGNFIQQSFSVRRKVVMRALRWLKKYHRWYRDDPDLIIDESNLDWMNGCEEAQLPGLDVIEAEDEPCLLSHGAVCGINDQNYNDATYDGLQPIGSVNQSLHGVASEESDCVMQSIRNACKEVVEGSKPDNDHSSMKFPTVSIQPQSEYRGMPIFSNAYPWLFPGGVGDIDENNICERGYVGKWLRTLTLYYDGRFCRDPTFCFYALNFKQRYQNSVSGSFFIKGYISTKTSLDDLIRRIRVDNDTRFIEQLIHFSSKIRGSAAFWRSKRLEVFSWINRMIELKKGPPTLFITLSCAEHYWKDVQRLLQDRYSYLPESDRPNLSTKALVVKAIKEFSIVVQEFFITKVKHWLTNFGKKVFGIQHYFVRFEFTEGRGEIHAHILAVADNIWVFEQAYKCRHIESERAKIFLKYATEVLGLTSIHPATNSEGQLQADLVVSPEGLLPIQEVYRSNYSPCSRRFCDVDDMRTDQIQLVNSVQMHKCGEYCMRSYGESKRFCRAGCGVEATKGNFDTPGFKTIEQPEIRRELNGTLKLALPRNSSRMVQSSMKLLQMWRANCDVQLLLYESDPKCPDLYEISKVTDYVVSYACKGNKSLEAEVEVMSTLIQSTQTVTGDDDDLVRLSRKMLNKTTSSRIISKQECMIENTDLPLTICSELIQVVSITGSSRITTSDSHHQSFIEAYASRPSNLEDVSFSEFVHQKLSNTDGKILVVHFVGLNNAPTFPVTPSYARSTLITHVPWRDGKFHKMNDSFCIKEFHDTLDQHRFPSSVKLNYLQAKNRYEQQLKSDCSKTNEPAACNEDDLEDDDNMVLKVMATMASTSNSSDAIDNQESDVCRGHSYDWAKRHTDCDPNLNGSTWLDDCLKNRTVQVNMDEFEPELKNLSTEQRAIAKLVLKTIIDWMEGSVHYKPLRMTVTAGAGRGKSYLIQQLTKTIRKMFQRDDVVITAAFTGSAAYNIGGRTCHSSFGICPANPNQEMSSSTRERLLNELRYMVALFIDERSMLSASILGAAERNVSCTCHGGSNQDQDWGGIPVVILWGDDYQLPPVDINGKGKGAFYCYDDKRRTYLKQSVEINGMIQFQNFSRTVFSLTLHQRTNETEFIDIQDRVRVGAPSKEDIQTLLSLNIHRVPLTIRNQIESDAGTVYLFGTRKKCSEFNTSNLINIQSQTNPVAIIKSRLPRKSKQAMTDNSSYPQTTVLCRNAKVSIKGKNFCPEWGLYNGAIGTVVEIVYSEGQSPNNGQFPLYVLVDFPGYIGPAFVTNRSTWVPIPTVKHYDQASKTEIIVCPLQLSFARTIHTFQGYQAGPRHNIKRIVCDVGVAKLESTFPGLFYTALSRASTMGTTTDRSLSAIFFNNLDSSRLEQLRQNASGQTYKMIERRDTWTNILEQNIQATSQIEDSIIQRALSATYNEIQLIEATLETKRRKTN